MCVDIESFVSTWKVLCRHGKFCVDMKSFVSTWKVLCRHGKFCVDMKSFVSTWKVLCRHGNSISKQIKQEMWSAVHGCESSWSRSPTPLSVPPWSAFPHSSLKDQPISKIIRLDSWSKKIKNMAGEAIFTILSWIRRVDCQIFLNHFINSKINLSWFISASRRRWSAFRQSFSMFWSSVRNALFSSANKNVARWDTG